MGSTSCSTALRTTHIHIMSDYDLKLYYFNIAGKGEAIRLALKHANIEFEDYRFKEGEFGKMKESGELAFGQVPALKVTNKKTGESELLTQSGSILRFVAQIAEKDLLIPSDPVKAAKVNAIVDQEADVFQSARCIIYRNRFGLGSISEEKVAEIKNEINETVIPKHFELLEKMIEAGKTGWLAGTKNPSIADFQFAGILPAVKGGWTGKKFDLTKYEKLNKLVDDLYNLEAVKEFYKTNEYRFWF